MSTIRKLFRSPSARSGTLAVLVGLSAVAACGEAPVEEEVVARPVKILNFGEGAFGAGIQYPGEVRAVRQADVAFEVPGRVIEFPVVQGQRVRQGTLLARVDPRDFEAQRDASLANLNASESDYYRYQELYAADAVSLQQLEVQRRNFQVADAAFRTAQKALDDTELRAPFDGIVAAKLVEDYVTVQAKQVVLIFQDDSQLEIVANIPERDAVIAEPFFRDRERFALLGAAVELSSLPGRSFPAMIREFATTADPVTRTFEARFTFDAPTDVAIRPGMTARLTMSPAAEAELGGFFVPATAVVADEGGSPFVWQVDEGSMTVSRASVEVGSVAGEEIQILGGLRAGDRIAVSGVHNLRDGMLVRALEN